MKFLARLIKAIIRRGISILLILLCYYCLNAWLSTPDEPSYAFRCSHCGKGFHNEEDFARGFGGSVAFNICSDCAIKASTDRFIAEIEKAKKR